MGDWIKVYKNGATVHYERTSPSGMHHVTLRSPSGEVNDRVRCDDRLDALAYRRSFCKIARNM